MGNLLQGNQVMEDSPAHDPDLPESSKVEKPVPKFGTGKGKIQIVDPDWEKAIETESELKAFLEGQF